MSRLSILILLTSVICQSSDVTQCPAPCKCSRPDDGSVHVSCSNGQLTAAPSGLPFTSESLDLSGNELTSLGADDFFYLQSLTSLNVSRCEVSTVQGHFVQSLSRLVTFDLSHNNIASLPKDTLTGSNSLMYLYLHHNHLTDVDYLFQELFNLTRLDLNNNKITSLTANTFQALSNLRYLDLSANEIRHIDKQTFRPLVRLSYLVLKLNPLKDTVHHLHFHSSYLSYLDLSETGLERVPKGIPSSLRYLQLRRNNITEIRKHDFRETSSLNIIVLDDNQISQVHREAFRDCDRLQQLWFNQNLLTELPQYLPVSLSRLLVDNNLVEAVTADLFLPGSQMTTLSLSGNHIEDVSPEAFLELKELESLDLSNNKIRYLVGDTFQASGKMDSLKLSKNPLEFYYARCFHGLTSLLSLSLAYIETPVLMHENIFRDLTSLVRLDLDSSPGVIRALLSSTTFLSAFPKLEELNVRNTDLTTLRSDFPNYFPSLSTFRVSSSKWHCDADLMWMKRWLLETTINVEYGREQRCSTPKSLHNRRIIELDDAEFPFSTSSPAPLIIEHKSTSSRPNDGNFEIITTSSSEHKHITSTSIQRRLTSSYLWQIFREFVFTTQSPEPHRASTRLPYVVDDSDNNDDNDYDYSMSESKNSVEDIEKLRLRIIIIVVCIAVTVVVSAIIVVLICYYSRRSEPPYSAKDINKSGSSCSSSIGRRSSTDFDCGPMVVNSEGATLLRNSYKTPVRRYNWDDL